ncbi:MAG: OmpH family outer membrane protein [Candidatus Cloacimonetes bacterium]|jgi:outer membrane protein|nr:OmpH family outer membrane protein [Candidatus Cloacimonadota bacterium]MDY0299523.1 OmpH family outer membrane protein [Candidatus Cloacimonadaceae bacterium]MCB5278279.1 OmpH family outer membrane protein [Candidatus Cloacimonadota bacterium]MCK9333003.1 OmpH family outer membrane protein [Candidatus Cloacimonadota bacterium]MDD2211199.1 OmpH family outer membrane protein [Candidatus Cloacimonadota bacterium]
MKRLSILILALLSIAAIYAQNAKLGYVNTDQILFDSNEAAEIARLFQLDRQNWSNQIRSLDEEIKQMERDFEIRRLSISEASKRELQGQIDSKKEEAGRLLEEYFGENGRAEQRYRELIEPLTKKIHDIITKIAEDEKYTMILDVSMGVVLYASPAIDLTDQVLQELNKDTIPPSESTEEPKAGTEPPKDPFADKNMEGFGGFTDDFNSDYKPEEKQP